jgi:uncharacterized protein (DUF983 family)
MKLVEIRSVLANAMRLRCPRCGRDKLFESFSRVRHSCRSCGLVFQQEEGFFVGAIYINVAVTYFLILGIYLFALFVIHTVGGNVYLAMIVTALAVPVVCFRLSRSVWLAMNFLILKPPPGKNL